MTKSHASVSNRSATLHVIQITSSGFVAFVLPDQRTRGPHKIHHCFAIKGLRKSNDIHKGHE